MARRVPSDVAFHPGNKSSSLEEESSGLLPANGSSSPSLSAKSPTKVGGHNLSTGDSISGSAAHGGFLRRVSELVHPDTAEQDLARFSKPPRLKHPLQEHVILATVRLGLYYTFAFFVAIPSVALLGVTFLLAGFLRCLWNLFVRRQGCLCCFRTCEGPKISCDPLWPLGAIANPAIKPVGEMLYAVVTLHSDVPLVDIRQLLWSKIVRAQNPNTGELMYPRFSQILRRRCCASAFTETDMDIQNHVVVFDQSVFELRTLNDLESYLNRADQYSRKFDMSLRPPWQISVIPEFGETKCTLCILCFHRTLIEELCLYRLLCLLNDSEITFLFEPRLELALVQHAWLVGQAMLLYPLNYIRAVTRGPEKALWRVARRVARNQSEYAVTSDQRVVTWARIPSVDQLFRAEKLLHCTSEELFLSFIAGALQRHFKSIGVRHPPDLYAAIPIPIKRGASHVTRGKCCAFSVAPFRLPVSVDGCIPRLWEVQQEAEEVLDGPIPYGCAMTNRIWRTIFPAAHTAAQASASTLRGCSSVITFVRGAPAPQHYLQNAQPTDISMCSHRVHSILQFAPCPRNIPVQFTFVQLGREVVLSLQADPTVFPSPDNLLVNFQREIQKLLGQISCRLLSPLISAALMPLRPVMSQSSSWKRTGSGISTGSDEGDSASEMAHVTPDKVSVDISTPATSEALGEPTLEDLENLLATVQAELTMMKINPHQNREQNLARLASFEQRMLSLQAAIAEKLRQNGGVGFCNDREHIGRSPSTPAGVSGSEGISAGNLLTPSRSEQELDHEHRPLRRKRSRRTSSPTSALRAQFIAQNP